MRSDTTRPPTPPARALSTLGLVWALSALAACSDPKEPSVILKDSPDMTQAQDMRPADSGEDLASGDQDSSQGPPMEQEPNDVFEQANPLDMVRGVRGVIDEKTDARTDKDVFWFTAPAHSVVTFEFDAGPAFTADGKRGVLAQLTPADGFPEWLVLTDVRPGRSIYLPYEGTYALTVQQLETRVRPNNRPVPPHGGPQAYYTLKPSIKPASATEPPIEFGRIYRGDNSDGEPDLYPFTLTEESTLTSFIRTKINGTQVTQVRPTLWSVSRGELMTDLDQYNDQQEDGDWLALTRYRLPAGEYVLVMDNFFNPEVARYELMLRKHDGLINDPVELRPGQPYQGHIDPAFDREDKDEDVFEFTLEPGEQTKITIKPTGSSVAQLAAWLFQDDGQTLQPQTRAKHSAGQTTLSVYNAPGPGATRKRYVVIPDLDGKPRQEDQDYGYVIEREEVPFAPIALDEPHMLLQGVPLTPGVPLWLEIQAPANHLWTLYVPHGYSVDYLVQRERDLRYFSGQTDSYRLRNQIPSYLTTREETVHVGIIPVMWMADPEVTIYEVMLAAVDLSTQTYVEQEVTSQPSTLEQAVELDLSRAVSVRSGLTQQPRTPSSAYYKVFLEQGQTLAITTEPSPSPTAVYSPMELFIYDDQANVLLAQSGVCGDSPYDGERSALFGGMMTLPATYPATIFTARARGTYIIELRGKPRGVQGQGYVSGDYVLKVAPMTLSPRVTRSLAP